MAQEIEQRKTGFRRWFEAGFGAETLPIIPPEATLTAGTEVRPEHRGKTPGTRTQAGTWSGLGGKWSDELQATVSQAKQWATWGASVGLQSREFLGLDIDVEDETQAAAVEALAFDLLGFAPVRFRAGSPRRLLVYRRTGETVRKVRRGWAPDDKGRPRHAVELLGHGQQFVVEGPHPKGGAYEWRGGESPCEWGPDGLTPIELEHVQRFFDALERAREAGGWGEPVRAGGSSGGAIGARKSLDNPSLWAAKPELVLAALAAWPNTPDNVPTHDDFVTALAAIKAALGPARQDHYPAVEAWALAYGGNDDAYVQKTWDSITDATLGAEWLFQAAKTGGGDFTADAQEDFDEAGDELVAETPLERMLRRYVWVQQLERYVDLNTGAMLTARAFNAANVAVAEFGRTGVQSAEAAFQNARGARKAKIATYRPGRPALLEDENAFGVRVTAVNLWRPSPIVPLQGVTADTVRPWLDHVEAIFGAPGEAAREHFLDWCAFAIQNPGRKINHALVLLGEQGIGKDTVFAPVLEAIGNNNVATVKTETLTGQWTHFLLSQVVVVQEMMTFTKRETYNKMKDWIAAPPYFVEINRKNQNQFTIPNVQLWVIFTNHDDAIALDEDDRRFFVHRSCLETPREPEYYTGLYRWFAEESGAAKVAGWLKSRDLSRFNPSARPPATAAKAEMIDHALPPPVRWLAEQFEEGGPFNGRELLSARELIQYARSAFDAPGKVADGVREKHAIAAMRRAGFQPVGAKLKLADGSTVRLWTRSARPSLLAQLPHGKLVQRYTDEIAKTEAQRKGA